MPLLVGNVFLYGVRYGIRTRILRFLALRHGALTFRPNAHKTGAHVQPRTESSALRGRRTTG